MKTTFTIPENWNEVLLIDYLEYYKRIKPYFNAEDEDILNNAAIDAAIYHICKIDYDTFKSLDAAGALQIKSEVAKLLAQSTSIPLVKTFTIELDGETIEYGFEPNLDEMSYGCYLDLAESGKDVWNNIWAFLATLYRPITTKTKDRYRIAEYEGTDFSIIPNLKHTLTADIALGAIGFFLRLQEELLSATLSYSANQLKKKKVLSFLRGKTSANDMEVLADSTSLLTTILPKSMRLPDYQSTYASLLSSIEKNEVK